MRGANRIILIHDQFKLLRVVRLNRAGDVVDDANCVQPNQDAPFDFIQPEQRRRDGQLVRIRELLQSTGQAARTGD